MPEHDLCIKKSPAATCIVYSYWKLESQKNALCICILERMPEHGFYQYVHNHDSLVD